VGAQTQRKRFVKHEQLGEMGSGNGEKCCCKLGGRGEGTRARRTKLKKRWQIRRMGFCDPRKNLAQNIVTQSERGNRLENTGEPEDVGGRTNRPNMVLGKREKKNNLVYEKEIQPRG